jgi:hypothetical protein
MLEEFQHATDELAWRFLCADAAIGIRAQSIDGERSGSVFGLDASYRTHIRHFNADFRKALARRGKVDATLAECGTETADVLRSVFEPFGRASRTLENAFHSGQFSLVALAVNAGSTRREFKEKHKDAAAEAWGILDWLEGEVRSLAKTTADIERLRTTKPSGHFFERILNECKTTAQRAIATYDQHLIERLEAEEKAHTKSNDDYFAAESKRMGRAS